MKRYSLALSVALLSVCLGLIGCAGSPKAATAKAVVPVKFNEAQFQELQQYDQGKARTALLAIQASVDQATPEQYPAYEQRLLKVLAAPDTSVAAKDFVTRQLVRVGSDQCVPAVAALLGDAKLTLAANRVLAVLPDDAAATALRQALDQTTGSQRVAVIASLGQRRDGKSIAALQACATAADPAVATAALVALGRIGTSDADKALVALTGKVSPALAETLANARLAVASQLLQDGRNGKALAILGTLGDNAQPATIRAGAVYGTLKAQDADAAAALFNVLLAGTDEARKQGALAAANDRDLPRLRDALIRKLPALLPATQLTLLEVLGDHPENDLHPALLKLIASNNAAVRQAALTKLSRFGQPEDVAPLVKIAAEEKGADRPAYDVLRQMTVPGVGAALAAVAKNGEGRQRVSAIELIGLRGDASAMPGLAAGLDKMDKPVALAALRALDRLGTPGELPALLRLACRTTEPASATAAIGAARQICARSNDKVACEKIVLPVVKDAAPALQASLLGILSAVGTPDALIVTRTALASSDTTLHDAAARALSDWPTAEAAADLLALAKSAATVPQKVLALRGYLRVVSTATNLTEDQRLAKLREAWAICPRAEEKKQVLGALAALGAPAALDMAQESLKDPELATEATLTTLTLAKGLSANQPDRAEAAFKAIEALPTVPAEVHQQIAEARKTAKALEGYIGRWLLAGPFEANGKDGTALFDVAFGPENIGEKVEWHPIAIGADPEHPWLVDFKVPMPRDNAVVYVKANIISDKAQPILLLLNSDDGVKAWLNGKLVHANNANRPAYVDPDKVPAALNAGPNQLLLKITQNSGGWGAAARLRAPDGGTLSGVYTTVDAAGR